GEVRRQPALDKSLRKELCHCGRDVLYNGHVANDIAGLPLADEQLDLRTARNLRASCLDAVFLREGVSDLDDLACAVIDGDRRLGACGLYERIEAEILRRPGLLRPGRRRARS